jgi:hypothetical protein
VSGGPGSAGVAWAGRTLASQPFTGDDGRADPALAAALAGGGEQALADALAGARVLVPVVALPGDELVDRPGDKLVDETADMAVATLVGAAGRRALPVFSALETLAGWDASARPVPVQGPRAALSAVADGCDVLVVDPAGPRTAVVRRPVLWALAQGRPWLSPAQNPAVTGAVSAAALGVTNVEGVRCGRGVHGDLAVLLGVRPRLAAGALTTLIGAVRERLAASPVLAERVQGLELRVVAAAPEKRVGNS